jgi:large subunit ribosomal protein L24
MKNKLKIRKGDRVVVLTGRDKGKKGEVLRVIPDERRALVRGVNMVQRHQRQTPTAEGGIVAKEAAIDISNIAIVDPKTGAPTRIGYKILGDGRKVRFARKSGEVIDG